uniref:Uncharacterized protein n=1 Tax=Anguilla anguilla TaxID=7936 RepID=A0A0E9PXJ5_ANGAN
MTCDSQGSCSGYSAPCCTVRGKSFAKRDLRSGVSDL